MNIVIFKTALKCVPIYEDSLWLIAVLYLWLIAVSGVGIISCVLGNNNKNVIKTLKHLESLVKSTLKTTPVTNSSKYPVNFIDF